MDLYLAGVRAEETLQAVRALETATAVAGRATATAQAQAIAATRAAWEAEATRTAWEATATVASQRATATAGAQAAAATATATSWAATATADAVAWSQAATATRSAWEVQATSTAVAAAAIATVQAATAEQARLEAERARLVYPVRAYGPWALLFTAFALLLWAGYRMARAAEARAWLSPGTHGAMRRSSLTRRATSLTPTVPSIRSSTRSTPSCRRSAQDRVTARDQAVDLMSRGLPPGRRPTPPTAAGFGGGLRRVLVLRRLGPGRHCRYPPPPMAQALEADWAPHPRGRGMNEVYQVWTAVLNTLRQRGLLSASRAPVADGILLPTASSSSWIWSAWPVSPVRPGWTGSLHLQLRAALGGRPVVVTDFFGLAVQVRRVPLQPHQPLPATPPGPLSPAGGTYLIPLGVSHRGGLWALCPTWVTSWSAGLPAPARPPGFGPPWSPSPPPTPPKRPRSPWVTRRAWISLAGNPRTSSALPPTGRGDPPGQ